LRQREEAAVRFAMQIVATTGETVAGTVVAAEIIIRA
jgi:hypothetical protein